MSNIFETTFYTNLWQFYENRKKILEVPIKLYINYGTSLQFYISFGCTPSKFLKMKLDLAVS